jgi:hypothetical protein
VSLGLLSLTKWKHLSTPNVSPFRLCLQSKKAQEKYWQSKQHKCLQKAFWQRFRAESMDIELIIDPPLCAKL